MPQKISELKRQFRKKQIKSTQRLLKLSRVVLYLIEKLNNLDGMVLKLMCILLGFQYDIYICLWKVSYDRHYLEQAERIKYQIEITLPLIGE